MKPNIVVLFVVELSVPTLIVPLKSTGHRKFIRNRILQNYLLWTKEGTWVRRWNVNNYSGEVDSENDIEYWLLSTGTLSLQKKGIFTAWKILKNCVHACIAMQYNGANFHQYTCLHVRDKKKTKYMQILGLLSLAVHVMSLIFYRYVFPDRCVVTKSENKWKTYVSLVLNT